MVGDSIGLHQKKSSYLSNSELMLESSNTKAFPISNKTLPLQTWTGSYGFRRLRLLEFLGTRHMKVVKMSGLHTVRLYYPGDIPSIHFC